MVAFCFTARVLSRYILKELRVSGGTYFLWNGAITSSMVTLCSSTIGTLGIIGFPLGLFYTVETDPCLRISGLLISYFDEVRVY
jgi:hypothetical protein